MAAQTHISLLVSLCLDIFTYVKAFLCVMLLVLSSISFTNVHTPNEADILSVKQLC